MRQLLEREKWLPSWNTFTPWIHREIGKVARLQSQVLSVIIYAKCHCKVVRASTVLGLARLVCAFLVGQRSMWWVIVPYLVSCMLISFNFGGNVRH